MPSHPASARADVAADAAMLIPEELADDPLVQQIPAVADNRWYAQVDPIESVVFNTRTPAARDRNRLTATRPLDTWQERLTEARAAVAADALVAALDRAAAR